MLPSCIWPRNLWQPESESLGHFAVLFLLSQHGRHHDLDEFAIRGQEPKDEVQIYTWKDASLRELTDLVSVPQF